MFICVVAIDVPCLDHWLWISGGGGGGLGLGMFVVVVWCWFMGSVLVGGWDCVVWLMVIG